jgi:hypothetical protein
VRSTCSGGISLDGVNVTINGVTKYFSGSGILSSVSFTAPSEPGTYYALFSGSYSGLIIPGSTPFNQQIAFTVVGPGVVVTHPVLLNYSMNIDKKVYSPGETLRMDWSFLLPACANDCYGYSVFSGVVNNQTQTVHAGCISGYYPYAGSLYFTVPSAGGVYPASFNGLSVNYTVVSPTCTLPWGGTLANGSSVTAYSASSVACGSLCSSSAQTRTCINGVLSGSYVNPGCSAAACPCMLPWGGTLANGGSIAAYNVSSACTTAECSAQSQVRTCTNGVLSGGYVNGSCSVTNCSGGYCSSPTYSCTTGTNQYNIYSDWWSNLCSAGNCGYSMTIANYCGTSLSCGTETCTGNGIWKERCKNGDIWKYQYGKDDSCSPSVAGCDLDYYHECPGTETEVEKCAVGYTCSVIGTDDAECVVKAATWTEI